MTTYLSDYDEWAASNFTDNNAYNNTVSAQTNMMTIIGNLINGL